MEERPCLNRTSIHLVYQPLVSRSIKLTIPMTTHPERRTRWRFPVQASTSIKILMWAQVVATFHFSRGQEIPKVCVSTKTPICGQRLLDQLSYSWIALIFELLMSIFYNFVSQSSLDLIRLLLILISNVTSFIFKEIA